MTRYCNNCYISCFFKSRKPKKLCLNLSSKFPPLRSIIKKFPNVCVHKLKADFIIDESAYIMVSYNIVQTDVFVDFD